MDKQETEGATNLYVVKTDSPRAGKGVFVTERWDEVAVDIKDRIEQSGVTVEKVALLTVDSAALLTDLEHEAMELSGRLANLIGQIVGDGPQAQNDWSEAAQHLHVVQHMILAQAAARAYPERYRLLGGTLQSEPLGSPPELLVDESPTSL